MKIIKNKLLWLVLFVSVVAALRYSPWGQLLTFENLKANRESLAVLVRDHYVVSVIAFIAVYIGAVALSMPGAVILTIAGGFLFGTTAGTVYVNIGATAGATLAFLIARYLLGARLQDRYRDQLSTFNRELAQNGARYLLTVRLIPVFPFFLINFLSGLTAIPVRTFIWTTSLGIMPASAVFAYAGRRLGEIESLAGILSKEMATALVFLALLALLPALMKLLTRSGKAVR